jgi:hypothetical protein
MGDLHTFAVQFGALAGVAASSFVVVILRQLAARLQLNLTAQQEARVRYFAEKAVHIAEETIETKGAGAQRLALASSLVTKWLPKLDLTEVENAIHAEIARQRADVGNQLFQPKASA